MQTTTNGLTTIASDFPVKETIERLTSIAQAKDMMVFARIDHTNNATQAGLTLRPTVLLIFGNPKAGTFLMQDKQISGIDLPIKALAWQDEHGKTWLTYNDSDWLAERHGLNEKSGGILKAMADLITTVINAAAKD